MDSVTSSIFDYFQNKKENDALSLILYKSIFIIIVGGRWGIQMLQIVGRKRVSSLLLQQY